MTRHILVGVGNELRGDDAAGLQVARRVRQLATGRRLREAEIWESDADVTRLLEAFTCGSDVVLVDAVAPDGHPGRITCWSVDSLLQQRPALSSHGLGVLEAIELGRELGSMPQNLEVYGIEAVTFVAGRPLSPPVSEAVLRLANRLSRSLGV